jgi:hypothetical protein
MYFFLGAVKYRMAKAYPLLMTANIRETIALTRTRAFSVSW